MQKECLQSLTIKLLFFSLIFLNQACQTDEHEFDNIEQKLALQKFENLVKESTVNIQQIVEKQNEFLAKGVSSEKINETLESEARLALNPIVNGTKELLSTFNISEYDLSEDFDDINDSRTAIIGIVLLASKDKSSNETAMNFSNLFVTQMHAQSLEDVGRCAAAAVGADLLYSLAEGGASKWTKKALTKLVKKVTSRFLGPIGVGIAVVSFGLCLAA